MTTLRNLFGIGRNSASYGHTPHFQARLDRIGRMHNVVSAAEERRSDIGDPPESSGPALEAIACAWAEGYAEQFAQALVHGQARRSGV